MTYYEEFPNGELVMLPLGLTGTVQNRNRGQHRYDLNADIEAKDLAEATFFLRRERGVGRFSRTGL